MFLDGDAYAVADPAPLFAELENHPFIYWQNLPGTTDKLDRQLLAGILPHVAAEVQGGITCWIVSGVGPN